MATLSKTRRISATITHPQYAALKKLSEARLPNVSYAEGLSAIVRLAITRLATEHGITVQ